jgi:preprotein translocase subunit YajC
LRLIDLLAQAASEPSGAAAAPTSKPAPGWAQNFFNYFPLIILGILLMFLLGGGKRKQERQRQDMLKLLKKGDEVVTIGGQIGKVMDSREDRVLLKVDEGSNTKIWFLRSAIHRVLEDDKAESK